MFPSTLRMPLMLCLVALPHALLQAQSDTVVRKTGSSIRGEILSSTPTQLRVDTSSGEREVSVADIEEVRFGDEPSWLKNSKMRYREDRFAACFESMIDSEMESLPPLIRQEAEFYQAMSAGKVALTSGDITLNQAGTLLKSFLDSHPNSIHRFAVQEMFGDLAMSSGSFTTAGDSYRVLVDSGITEIAAPAKLKLGKALLLDEKYDQAGIVFQEVNNQQGIDESTRLIAQCYWAQSISYQGQADNAIATLTEILQRESADQEALFARLYNALGTAHLQLQDWKAARLAFMHTQLMFYRDREAYAEALFHLHHIAKQLQDSERATKTRQLLKSRFPNSHWARQL